MLGIVIIAVIGIAMLLMLAKPKLGLVLLWPLLFLYPHYYMYEKNIIPLNMGIDDIFICSMFVIVFLRRNIIEGVLCRFGYSFWISLCFLFLLVISNLNSYLIAPDQYQEFLKAGLKGFITLFLCYSFVNLIDDMKDMERLLAAFCISACAGAIIMILQNFFPERLIIFTSPSYAFSVQYGGDISPVGAFMNRSNAAIVLGISIIFLLSTMHIKSRSFKTTTRLVMVGIMMVAILLTKSRSGFLCLTISLIIALFVRESRRYAIAFMVMGLLFLTVLPFARDALLSRFGFGDITQTDNIGILAPIKDRLTVVFDLWQKVTLRNLLLGQNDVINIIKGQATPHNMYFGIPLTYGIGGSLWLFLLVVMMLRKTAIMKQSLDLNIVSLARVVNRCLVVFLLYGIIGGITENYYVRYCLFLLTVISQRGLDISLAESEEGRLYEHSDQHDGKEENYQCR
ncbi:MAG: hypothetical protein WC765_00280 [Phycisphaerae bacterium]|jgi:hypothetical protein